MDAPEPKRCRRCLLLGTGDTRAQTRRVPSLGQPPAQDGTLWPWVKRISENKSTNKFGKHGGGFPKAAGEAHKTGIRKQRKTNIRKQNKKTGKRTSENGLDTTKKQKTKEKVPIRLQTLNKSCPDFAVVLLRPHQVKEGHAPFTPLFRPQIENSRKSSLLAAVLSPLGFGHKPRGVGRPRSFHPLFCLQTGGRVKDGRGPFTPLFCPTNEVEGRPRSFHPSVLAPNRVVKAGRGPFTFRFWPQTEW